VALTVTSPPYWNAIDYDVHEREPGGWYRTRRYAAGYQAYEEYLDWAERIFGGILAKTRPGGFCAVVVGTVLLDGRHYPAPFDLAARLRRAGWQFHQDIVWHKTTAGVKRAGVLIQHPYPGYFYPNIMTEYILVFQKPGGAIYRGRGAAERERARVPIDRLYTMDVANNVWHIAPVPPGHLDHPCPFPEEIPWRLIRLYSYAGDVVLDPFAGSGQTLKVARHLGRRFVGYETSAKYAALARRRLQEPLAVRGEQLVATFGKVPLAAGLGGAGTARRSPRRRARAGARGAGSRARPHRVRS
jgi:DNA modification methylase